LLTVRGLTFFIFYAVRFEGLIMRICIPLTACVHN